MRAAAAIPAVVLAVAAGTAQAAPEAMTFGCERGVEISVIEVEKDGEPYLILDLPQRWPVILELRSRDGTARVWGEPGGRRWGWIWREATDGSAVLSRIAVIDSRAMILGPETAYLTACGALG